MKTILLMSSEILLCLDDFLFLQKTTKKKTTTSMRHRFVEQNTIYLKHNFKTSSSLAFSQIQHIINACLNQEQVKNKTVVNYFCYYVSLRNDVNAILTGFFLNPQFEEGNLLDPWLSRETFRLRCLWFTFVIISPPGLDHICQKGAFVLIFTLEFEILQILSFLNSCKRVCK